MRVRISTVALSLALGFALGAAPVAVAAESPPKIESLSVSHVSSGNATLEAEINPGGLETSYEFHLEQRWGCEEAFPPCEPPIFEILLPEGRLPASFHSRHVSLDLGSVGVTLTSDLYEYSVSAANSAGSASAPAQRFNPFAFPSEEEEVTGHPLPPVSTHERIAVKPHRQSRRWV